MRLPSGSTWIDSVTASAVYGAFFTISRGWPNSLAMNAVDADSPDSCSSRSARNRSSSGKCFMDSLICARISGVAGGCGCASAADARTKAARPIGRSFMTDPCWSVDEADREDRAVAAHEQLGVDGIGRACGVDGKAELRKRGAGQARLHHPCVAGALDVRDGNDRKELVA